MHYMLHLSYDGTRYAGWQRQGNTDNTISAKLEKVFSVLDGRMVQIDGAGRTDAGVHALDQTATLDLRIDRTCQEIVAYANQYLPEDIAVTRIEPVPDRFHARLNAQGKIYRYEIRTCAVPDVFRRKYQWHLGLLPDEEKMRAAGEMLLGKHDFAAFCTAKPGKHSTERTLRRLDFLREEGTLCIEYEGDGFLYNMVRILTGTLVECGLGKREVRQIPEILASRTRARAGITAPAQGLTLVKVLYGEGNIPSPDPPTSPDGHKSNTGRPRRYQESRLP